MGDSIPGADPADVPAAWSATARHPGFATAARRLAGNMLDLCDADRRLSAIFRDAGRYITAMSAAYLHGAGGLTVPLLKQICAGSGLLSPGRARAMIDFLLHLGYLERAEEPGPAIRYLPTAAFLSAWCRHLQVAIEAAAVIEPGLTLLAQRLDSPQDFAVLLGIQAARLHALARGRDPFPALRNAFLHPYAGSQILWLLTVAGDREGPPATGTIPASPSAISHRFEVTHVHVRRLFRRAQEEGLIVYHGHGRLSFTPAGSAVITLHYAFQLSELVASGTEALARLEAEDRERPGD